MSTVAVVIEQRYERTPDGSVWAPMFAHSFWRRYLTVFDHVRVVARVREAKGVDGVALRADGEGVTFAPIPYYVGPWQYLRSAVAVTHAVRSAIQPEDAVVLRLDSQLAACVYPMLRRTGHPYGVEVVVDPDEVFRPGSRFPLTQVFRWKFTRQLKRQCADACAAAFVTRRALQIKYPPAPTAFSTHYSSVELPASAIVEAPRKFTRPGVFRVVTVGTLVDLRKAQDVLIDAVALCDGLSIELRIIGDGPYKEYLQKHAQRLGLQKKVYFLGQLPREDVLVELDSAHLFVLASRGEGLPRAAIEAMARAVPAIGSTVGGMKELLPADDLVEPGNAAELAWKLRQVLTDPYRMVSMSAHNLLSAQQYRDELLTERRNAFYQHVLTETERWLCRARPGA